MPSYIVVDPFTEDPTADRRYYAERFDPPWTTDRAEATVYRNHEGEHVIARLWKEGFTEARLVHEERLAADAEPTHSVTWRGQLAELQELLERRTVIEGRWWRGSIIKLDGYHFKTCLFENCWLWYETPDFVLSGCSFAGKVRFQQGEYRPEA
jgi:hypothetical protein